MHFEQRIIPNEPEQYIMKTSAGIEIITPEKDKPIDIPKESEVVHVKSDPVLIVPTGMSKEAAELYCDLAKWSFVNLKAKFVERI
jgi:hypothetical protein